MNLKSILCPVDFSEFSQSANEYASVLAKSTNAKIIYIHVPSPEIFYGSYAYADVENNEKEILKRLQEVVPTVEGVDCLHVVEFGSDSERIVEYAKENDVDLIVMGTHGRTGLRRFLMGSVAESVVRKSECPVLAIKSNSEVLQDS